MKALVVIAGVLAASAAYAQQQQTATEGTIDMVPGTQTVLTFDKPFTAVTVGAPDIIDALPKSDHTVILQARRPGHSDVMFFSDANLLHRVTINVGVRRSANQVMMHPHTSGGSIHNFVSYECNPICTRISAPIPSTAPPPVASAGARDGRGGGTNINVIFVPPAPAPAASD